MKVSLAYGEKAHRGIDRYPGMMMAAVHCSDGATDRATVRQRKQHKHRMLRPRRPQVASVNYL